VRAQLSVCNVLTHSLSPTNRLGVNRLIVFVYTHSNPDNGDLHCHEGAGLTVDDVSITGHSQFTDWI
jgi:hypothetical protein